MRELCLICNEEITAEGHFWRQHRIKASDYYLKYVPKTDLYTNELIPFTSREQYLLNDFINRSNLSNYLKQLNAEDKQNFCLDLLIRRRDIKGLVYAPTQIELKSLVMPTIITFNRIFPDGYYDVCEKNGFKIKFDLPKGPLVGCFDEKTHIIVDTREQFPLKFDIPFRVEKLDYGDYTLSDNHQNKNVYIERKSISDFISTLSAGYERFCRELDRAYNDNAHLVIIVEASMSYALSFNYSKWLSKFVRATPDFVFHRVRELCQRYPNIQFVFVNGSSEAATLTKLLLTSGGVCREFEIQYALDVGLILL